jgi:hypothetical protein
MELPWQSNLEQRKAYNLKRVNNLIEASDAVDIKSGLRKDILRAAVVLLHATTEDVLRSIAEERLPVADAERLNNVPCDYDEGGDKRIGSFTLSQIRDKVEPNVQDFVKKRVKAFLGRSNYNNKKDLENACTLIGIPAKTAGIISAPLDKMMDRRHNIVHQCDRLPMTDDYGQQRDIDKETVEGWVSSVTEFLETVMDRAAHPAKKTKGKMKVPRAV